MNIVTYVIAIYIHYVNIVSSEKILSTLFCVLFFPVSFMDGVGGSGGEQGLTCLISLLFVQSLIYPHFVPYFPLLSHCYGEPPPPSSMN